MPSAATPLRRRNTSTDACADHAEVERQFGDSYLALNSTVQPDRESTLLGSQDAFFQLRPWASLGWLQGRASTHAGRPTDISALLQSRAEASRTEAERQQLRPSSISSAPRLRRGTTTRCGCRGASGRSSRSGGARDCTRPPRSGRDAETAPTPYILRVQPSPSTPNLPRSFIHSAPDRLAAYSRFLFRLMRGTGRRRVSV